VRGSLGLLALGALACRHGSAAQDCSASVDPDVRTRARVQWRSELPGASWVVFDQGETPIVEDGSTLHEAVLLGLPALTEVAWRAVTADETVCEGTLTTGNLPASIPDLTVTTFDPERASPEPWLVGVALQSPSMVYVLDRAGHIVWYQEGAADRALVDVELLPGGVVAWNSFDAHYAEDEGEIFEVPFSGGEAVRWDTELGHHAFAATPNGFAYLMLDIRPWVDPDTAEAYDVAGDAIVELDRDGAQRLVWSTWDAFLVAPHDGWEDGIYEGVADWTHGNSLFWSEARSSFLYSSPVLRTLVEVSFDGAIQTYGPDGTYQVEDPDDAFAVQHDANWTDAGTLLTSMTNAEGATGAIEYGVDDAEHVFRHTWSYGFDLGVSAYSLGGARRLRNGNTLVNFGSAGLLQEVTPEGTVVWEVRAGIGTSFGQQLMFDDLYGRPPP
jgi:hypothetical protein